MRLKHSGCRVAPDTADAGTAVPAGSTPARRRPYSRCWFSQVAAMSKSSGTAATSLRQVAATLHSLAYPAALATGGPGAAELRLLSVNGAFMEATGRDAAALAGHGLAELREAKLCPRPGSTGRNIEARPLYDRNRRRRHWPVVQHETGQQPAEIGGASCGERGGTYSLDTGDALAL